MASMFTKSIIFDTTDACPNTSRQGERRVRVEKVMDGGVERGGGANCAASYLHCIAADRTEHSSSWSGPSRCTWCTSRPDLDAAPGRPFLFSLLSPPTSSGTSWNALKIHYEPHEIDPERAIAGSCICLYGVCQNYRRFLFIWKSISIVFERFMNL